MMMFYAMLFCLFVIVFPYTKTFNNMIEGWKKNLEVFYQYRKERSRRRFFICYHYWKGNENWCGNGTSDLYFLPKKQTISIAELNDFTSCVAKELGGSLVVVTSVIEISPKK